MIFGHVMMGLTCEGMCYGSGGTVHITLEEAGKMML